MTETTRDELLAAWLNLHQRLAERLAPPGSLSPDEVRGMSPQAFFEGISDGRLPAPPFLVLTGCVPIEWSAGHFVFQGVPDGRHYNPLGSVHGGYAATLLDSAMGCAIHTRLEAGQGYTTTDLRISYARALTRDVGPVRAEGRLVHLGRSTALAEGRILDVDGRLYATGSATCMILGDAGAGFRGP